ncbi:MAG TPA: DciA family protein [Xanthobacteraceae bacterium]|nr:DciA family protein [Xanthobacteraceae bacterium]
MNKPARPFAKPLRDLVPKIVGESFARQGFASAELVTRWSEIVGADVAAHSEPIKIQWARPAVGDEREPGTLVLRVHGPAAIEIQHQGDIICERVNRFLGWRAIARLAFRQAPLRRGTTRAQRSADAAEAARVAAQLSDVGDDDLKAALARLGAAVKHSA